MDLVVDANILFAALIKPGKTDELLFHKDFHLFAPDFLFEEFSKHEAFLLEKTERAASDFDRLLVVLKKRIEIVPFEEVESFIEQASVVSPDPNDVLYFALAIKLGASIWSNEKRLRSQNKVKIFATHELVKL